MSWTSPIVDAPRATSTAREGAPLPARIAVLGVVLAFVGEALTILRANHAWLIHRVPDDGFYYLEIAQRLARDEGPTFDGINETSGFHPLWQIALAALARVVPGDDALVKAAMLLALASFALAVVMVARVATRAVGPTAAWVGALVVVHTSATTRHLVDGMEGSMVVLALATVLWTLDRFWRDPSRRSAILLGLACTAAVLARLDLLTVIWVVPVVAVARARRWPLLGWCAASMAGIGGAALLWWYVQFGRLLSTSATVKSEWMTDRISATHGSVLSPGFAAEWMSNFQNYLGELTRDAGSAGLGAAGLAELLVLVLPTLALGGFTLVILGRVARRRTNGARSASPSAMALVTVGVVVVVKAAIDQLTEPDWALAWYSAPARVVTGFVVGMLATHLVTWLLARVRLAGWVAVALLVLALLPSSLTGWLRSGDDRPSHSYFYDQLDQAAAWLDENPQPGLYGAKDAGIVGYRLDPIPVVNLDGLVNDYDFAAYLETDPTILDRIRREGIDVYTGRLSDDGREAMGCARTLWVSSGRVPMVGGDGAVYVLDTSGC